MRFVDIDVIVCDKNAKNYEKCIKEDDKTWFSIQDMLCKANNSNKEEQKSCKNSVKDVKNSCKDNLKFSKNSAKSECKLFFGKESSCVSECRAGSISFR